ncbi:MAG: hypothetical protein F6K17_24855 [Okeania sp. SIO3C4]|nr:hypothetical protein [Okeania sp. SIO3C4]
MKKAEGRRQKAEGRRENCMGILTQTILSTPVDQKIRSQTSPLKGMKKNQVQYFKLLTSGVRY